MSLIDTALDAQLEQVQLFAGPLGSEVYGWLTDRDQVRTRTAHGRGKVDVMNEAGEYLSFDAYPEAVEYATRATAEDLSTAPTYVLTADMAQLVKVAAHSLGVEGTCPIPTADLLPTPSGFLWLEQPYRLLVYGPDLRKEEIRALFWYPSVTGFWDDEEQQRTGPGVAMIVFKDVAPTDDLPPAMRMLKPQDLTGWSFGLEWQEALTHDTFERSLMSGKPRGGLAHPAGADWRRFIYSVWQLCEQRISPRRASRHARRRWERSFTTAPNFGDVRVIDLRRYAMRGGEAVGESDPDYARQWSHRWVVSGHWRNQACGPGRSEHRTIWIDPHVKGPSDKPLIVRDDVYMIRR